MEIKLKLGKLLREQKKMGKKVVGYGAPAKATTSLNFFGIAFSMYNSQNI